MSLNLPIIDCSALAAPLSEIRDTPVFDKFVTAIGEACSSHGMVYLTNHGLDAEMVALSFSGFKRFFDLPFETKLKYRKSDAVRNFNGYTPNGDEPGEGCKESWDSYGPKMLQNFPKEVEELEMVIKYIYKSYVSLGNKLLYSLGKYLKLNDPEYFLKKHKGLQRLGPFSHNLIRTNYYMTLDSETEIPADSLRLLEHKDWGTLTFLIQDFVGGLEAKTGNGWVPVTPLKDTIILNVGLMLEVWSGGKFHAPLHRVRVQNDNASRIRQSIVFFINPDGECVCKPVVKVKPGWKPSYKKMGKETVSEYFMENIQISRS